MKKIIALAAAFLMVLSMAGCSASRAGSQTSQVAATTLPVYEFTKRICENTDIGVTRLVTESVSCLHDYSLNVRQVQAAESAELVVVSGAGLEDFMHDVLDGKQTIDASAGLELLESSHSHEGHEHHAHDPHIWLSPKCAKQMSRNICDGLSKKYPDSAQVFEKNLAALQQELDKLQAYGEETLKTLACREMITFHDGFAYFAHSFDLKVLKAVEEESGSEASAQELAGLIDLVNTHHLPAIFTETNGSTSAAEVISSHTGAKVFNLDMAMAGDSYFDSMYKNIDTVKEALG